MTMTNMTDTPSSPGSRPQAKRSFADLLANEFRFVPVAVGLLALGLFFASQSDVFLTSRNLSNLMIQSTVTGIIALGLVHVLLIGEIDLSVAATSGVASVFMSKLVVDFGYPIPVAVVAGILCGIFIGAASGRWVTMIGVPSFVVTLGVGLMLNGAQLSLLPATGRYSLLNTGVDRIAAAHLTDIWAWVAFAIAVALILLVKWTAHGARTRTGLASNFGKTVVLPVAFIGGLLMVLVLLLEQMNGIPMPVLIFLGLLGVASYVASETRFGLYLYAIGNNAEAVRRAGIKVDRIRIAAFAIAGGFSALAGILAASRILGVSVTSGGGIGGGALLLESIAAAVIGGVSLFGGRGTMIGALLGALIIATVSNGLNLMGVANEMRLIVTGALLVLAVSIDRGIERVAGAA